MMTGEEKRALILAAIIMTALMVVLYSIRISHIQHGGF